MLEPKDMGGEQNDRKCVLVTHTPSGQYLTACPPKRERYRASILARLPRRSDLTPRAASLPRKRQTLHDLHRVAREDRKVRMILEQFCRSFVRLGLNDHVFRGAASVRSRTTRGSGTVKGCSAPARAS